MVVVKRAAETKIGYQVADAERINKHGVAAANLEELIQTACNKLGYDMTRGEYRLCVEEHGTIVDDDEYLAMLPPQTFFVLLKDNEQYVRMSTDRTDDVASEPSQRRKRETQRSLPSSSSNSNQSRRSRHLNYSLDKLLEEKDFDDIFELITHNISNYLKTGEESRTFLLARCKSMGKMYKKYMNLISNAKTMISERENHPEWFKGLKKGHQNKEKSMAFLLRQRMRNYYNRIKKELKASDVYVDDGKMYIDRFLLELENLLKLNNFNEKYFNRKAAVDARMCDENGEFECGGLWNATTCSYDGEHTINPYRSRDDRIMFGTWNLDHKIEMRSIYPKIIESTRMLCSDAFKCTSCKTGNKPGGVEPDKYYLQIFTRNNLKLVDILCHDKGEHDAYSDVYAICKGCYDKAFHIYDIRKKMRKTL